MKKTFITGSYWAEFQSADGIVVLFDRCNRSSGSTALVVHRTSRFLDLVANSSVVRVTSQSA
jgi:hypothetical protein